MPTATIWKEKAAEAAKAARAIADAAATAERDLTDDERVRVNEFGSKALEFYAKWKAAKADSGLMEQLAALDEEFSAKGGLSRVDDAGWIHPKAGDSIADLFFASKAYTDLLASSPDGKGGFTKNAKIQSEYARFKTLVTGASDTSAGALVVNDNIGLQAGLDQFQRPLTAASLLTQATTASDTVEYVRVTGTTNNAATVAEATSSAFTAAQDVSGGGYKPESALALAKVTTNVRTFAHWIPVTTRALGDAGQIRNLIDNFLLYGLREEQEDQIVNGNGSGENFDGLTHVSGTQSQAWSSNILQTLRKARTLVRTVGRSTPSAYLLNPADWETIDLLQDNEARYIFGGPQRLGQPTLWGLPVVECEAVAAGTGIVGDFRKAVLWDRQESTIAASNQHLDFFTRNLVAILAEMRKAFGVIQPNAFVIADLTA